MQQTHNPKGASTPNYTKRYGVARQERFRWSATPYNFLNTTLDYEFDLVGFLNQNNLKWLRLQRILDGFISFYMAPHRSGRQRKLIAAPLLFSFDC